MFYRFRGQRLVGYWWQRQEREDMGHGGQQSQPRAHHLHNRPGWAGNYMTPFCVQLQWGSEYSGDLNSKHLNSVLLLVRHSDGH